MAKKQVETCSCALTPCLDSQTGVTLESVTEQLAESQGVLSEISTALSQAEAKLEGLVRQAMAEDAAAGTSLAEYRSFLHDGEIAKGDAALDQVKLHREAAATLRRQVTSSGTKIADLAARRETVRVSLLDLSQPLQDIEQRVREARRNFWILTVTVDGLGVCARRTADLVTNAKGAQ
jgi:chromosome segregation ATPase